MKYKLMSSVMKLWKKVVKYRLKFKRITTRDIENRMAGKYFQIWHKSREDDKLHENNAKKSCNKVMENGIKT